MSQSISDKLSQGIGRRFVSFTGILTPDSSSYAAGANIGGTFVSEGIPTGVFTVSQVSILTIGPSLSGLEFNILSYALPAGTTPPAQPEDGDPIGLDPNLGSPSILLPAGHIDWALFGAELDTYLVGRQAPTDYAVLSSADPAGMAVGVDVDLYWSVYAENSVAVDLSTGPLIFSAIIEYQGVTGVGS